jgi:hypothetical protein
MSFLSSTGGFKPISATGGTETTVNINGFDFIQHEFTGNNNYTFTVNDLGNDESNPGLVQYEIVGDGSSRTSGDNASTLDGNILRKVDPFFDSNTIFEHTSNGADFGSRGSVSNGSADSTVTAQAEVDNACRSNTWNGAVSRHYQDGGGRMPTFEEYINDTTKGSGCGHDGELNWTSTKDHDVGTTSRHWVVQGSIIGMPAGFPSTESNGTNNFLRQVADDDLNRPDPVILQDDLVLAEVQANNYPHTIVDGPTVQVQTYDLTLGQGSISDKIDHTGKQADGVQIGVQNQGDVIVRYPVEPIE